MSLTGVGVDVFYPRQQNMDFSICEGFNYGQEGLPRGLLIYDIACQWFINFWKRQKHNPDLRWPKAMADGLRVAVGKFHIGGHQLNCFVRFALNFVFGAGQVDGEIIETLWAELNKSSGSTRAMSLCHRQELIDAKCRDWNWQKMIGMGTCSLVH